MASREKNLKNKLHLLLVFIAFVALQANAGGYDVCIDYPVNYSIYLIGFSVILVLCFVFAHFLKFLKNILSYGVMLTLSFLLFVLLVNISPIKQYIEFKYNQKLECVFPSEESSVSEQTSFENTEVVEPLKSYTRDEFSKLAMGQSKESVLTIIGKPETTSQSSDSEYWYYHGKTIDPITGKIDYSIQLVFEVSGGYSIVKAINFN